MISVHCNIGINISRHFLFFVHSFYTCHKIMQCHISFIHDLPSPLPIRKTRFPINFRQSRIKQIHYFQHFYHLAMLGRKRFIVRTRRSLFSLSSVMKNFFIKKSVLIIGPYVTKSLFPSSLNTNSRFPE